MFQASSSSSSFYIKNFLKYFNFFRYFPQDCWMICSFTASNFTTKHKSKFLSNFSTVKFSATWPISSWIWYYLVGEMHCMLLNIHSHGFTKKKSVTGDKTVENASNSIRWNLLFSLGELCLLVLAFL